MAVFFSTLVKSDLSTPIAHMSISVEWTSHFIQGTYSVMQSDGISFSGDVVSDSFNNTSRDEDNILDLKYRSIYVLFSLRMISILKTLYENAY